MLGDSIIESEIELIVPFDVLFFFDVKEFNRFP